MDSWINDVTYLVMPSSHPMKGYEKEYEAAYQCWRTSWMKFRSEIGLEDPLYSDSFIIPDEMGVIFYKGECVGLSCFTYGSLDLGATQHNSYFKGWTDLALKRLKNISSNVVLCSLFTVGPQFTGKNHVVRWKEIVSLYTLLRFERSIAGVMAGQLNLSRKMNDAAGKDFGATILEESLPYHYGPDQRVQFVAYERYGIEEMKTQKGIHDLCDALWSRAQSISEYPMTNTIDPLKKAA